MRKQGNSWTWIEGPHDTVGGRKRKGRCLIRLAYEKTRNQNTHGKKKMQPGSDREKGKIKDKRDQTYSSRLSEVNKGQA